MKSVLLATVLFTLPVGLHATTNDPFAPSAEGSGATQASGAAPSPVSDIDALSIWRSVDFQQRFIESYIAETDVEPTLTIPERETLQDVLELKSEDKLLEAIALLQRERNEAASAVIDYTLGQFFHEQGEFHQAILAYEVAVEKYPKFRRAWQNLAILRVQAGDNEHAIVAFTHVIELGGGNAYTYGLLGFAYLQKENYIAAESAYRMAILLDGELPDWKYGLAESFLKQEQFPSAASLAGTMIQNDPNDPKLWMIQANAYIGMKQPLRAAENFELIDRLGGSTPASLSLLGDIYVNEELYDLAAPAYLRSFEIEPLKSVSGALRNAQVLASRGELGHTDVLVHRVQELAGDALTDADRTQLLKLQVRVAAADGATDEEARILKEIVDLDPLDGDALIMLGQHSRTAGDVEQAIFYFERAANIEEFESRAKVNQAQLLVAEGRYAEALPLLKRAQDLDPRDNIQKFLEQVERVAAQNR